MPIKIDSSNKQNIERTKKRAQSEQQYRGGVQSMRDIKCQNAYWGKSKEDDGFLYGSESESESGNLFDSSILND